MRTHRIRMLGALAVLGLAFAAPPLAAKVALQNATATFSQWDGFFNPAYTIDGVTAGFNNSWAIYRDEFDSPHAETIVWETQTDLALDGSTPLSFAIHQQDRRPLPGHTLGRFRLSYTTDDRAAFADGLHTGGDVTANWVVIAPVSARSTTGEHMTTLSDSSILVSGVEGTRPIYTVSSLLVAGGITGFRLEVMKDPSLPLGGPGRYANGNLHVSEFVVNSIPEPSSALLAGLGLAVLVARRCWLKCQS